MCHVASKLFVLFVLQCFLVSYNLRTGSFARKLVKKEKKNQFSKISIFPNSRAHEPTRRLPDVFAGGGGLRVKRIGMTVGNPRKLP